jgi:hypothetical protein
MASGETRCWLSGVMNLVQGLRVWVPMRASSCREGT